MMSRLFITPLAEQDLQDILEYIAQHRPQTARKWYEVLREKCAFLAQHPELGEHRPELADAIRSFSVNRWVIFYRLTGDVVEIHRILDGSRDVRSQIDRVEK